MALSTSSLHLVDKRGNGGSELNIFEVAQLIELGSNLVQFCLKSSILSTGPV